MSDNVTHPDGGAIQEIIALDDKTRQTAKELETKMLALVAFAFAATTRHKGAINGDDKKALVDARRGIDKMLTDMSGVSVLPSAFQIGDEVSVWLTDQGGPLLEFATVTAVHFTESKVHYDVVTYVPSPAELKNIDSAYIKPVGYQPEKP